MASDMKVALVADRQGRTDGGLQKAHGHVNAFFKDITNNRVNWNVRPPASARRSTGWAGSH